MFTILSTTRTSKVHLDKKTFSQTSKSVPKPSRFISWKQGVGEGKTRKVLSLTRWTPENVSYWQLTYIYQDLLMFSPFFRCLICLVSKRLRWSASRMDSVMNGLCLHNVLVCPSKQKRCLFDNKFIVQDWKTDLTIDLRRETKGTKKGEISRLTDSAQNLWKVAHVPWDVATKVWSETDKDWKIDNQPSARNKRDKKGRNFKVHRFGPKLVKSCICIMRGRHNSLEWSPLFVHHQSTPWIQQLVESIEIDSTFDKESIWMDSTFDKESISMDSTFDAESISMDSTFLIQSIWHDSKFSNLSSHKFIIYSQTINAIQPTSVEQSV